MKKHDIEQVEMLQEQLKEKDEFYEKQEMDLIEKHLDNFDPVDTTKETWQNYETKPVMNTGLEELLTEMNSVEDTHQNFSCGRNAQGSTQSKSSRNVEPPGIPEEEFQMILVSEEVEK